MSFVPAGSETRDPEELLPWFLTVVRLLLHSSAQVLVPLVGKQQ